VVVAYIALVPMSICNAAWFSIVGMLPVNVAGLSSIMVPTVAVEERNNCDLERISWEWIRVGGVS
jgi:hypothetical protein